MTDGTADPKGVLYAGGATLNPHRGMCESRQFHRHALTDAAKYGVSASLNHATFK